VVGAPNGATPMTLMIILGGIAALYLIRLLFRLASLALTVCLGLCAFLLLRDQGYGLAAALAMGLLTGIGFHLAGRWLFARTTSASIRLLIGLHFMAPAGAAGLGAGTALADLLDIDGGWRTCLAILVGVATACASWRSLAADRSSMGAMRDAPTVR
jgi:hypothetical protein